MLSCSRFFNLIRNMVLKREWVDERMDLFSVQFPVHLHVSISPLSPAKVFDSMRVFNLMHL